MSGICVALSEMATSVSFDHFDFNKILYILAVTFPSWWLEKRFEVWRKWLMQHFEICIFLTKKFSFDLIFTEIRWVNFNSAFAFSCLRPKTTASEWLKFLHAWVGTPYVQISKFHSLLGLPAPVLSYSWMGWFTSTCTEVTLSSCPISGAFQKWLRILKCKSS